MRSLRPSVPKWRKMMEQVMRQGMVETMEPAAGCAKYHCGTDAMGEHAF